jgi:DNase/tRNase domain of colicin-like bacteriocin
MYARQTIQPREHIKEIKGQQHRGIVSVTDQGESKAHPKEQYIMKKDSAGTSAVHCQNQWSIEGKQENQTRRMHHKLDMISLPLQRMKLKDFIVDDDKMSDSEEEYSYESEEDDEPLEYKESEPWDWNVPKNKDVKQVVSGKTYEFRYNNQGCCDFDNSLNGHSKIKKKADVNIQGQTTLKIKKKVNGPHFKAANILANTTGEKGMTTSPAGLTWHHHADKGRMQLLDRKVHQAFQHCGGKAIWGTI